MEISSTKSPSSLKTGKRSMADVTNRLVIAYAKIAELEAEEAELREEQEADLKRSTKKLFKEAIINEDGSKQSTLVSFFMPPSPKRSQRSLDESDIQEIIFRKGNADNDDTLEFKQAAQGSLKDEVSEEPEVSSSEKRVKVIWDRTSKQKAIALLKVKSAKDVYKIFKCRIPLPNLYRWKQNPTKALQKKDSGRRPKSFVLDQKLFDWFITARARKVEVDDSLLQKKGQKFCKELNVPMKCSSGYIWRWKKRYNISKRIITTHCSKKISEIRPLIEDFWVNYDEFCDQGAEEVWNFDETSICFELHKGETLEVKEYVDTEGKITKNKTVAGFATSKSKMRATVILFASNKGNKLPPIIILKSTAKCEIPQRLTDEVQKLVRENKVSVIQNASGWNNINVMKKYVIPHIVKYTNGACIFIADNFKGHTNEGVLELCQQVCVHIYFFPPETTSVLQPLDVSVNRSFKSYVRSEYKTWALTHIEEFIAADADTKYRPLSPNRNLVIQWICSSWDKVTTDTIQNGWRKAGLLGYTDERANKRRLLLKDLKRHYIVDENEIDYVHPDGLFYCNEAEQSMDETESSGDESESGRNEEDDDIVLL